MKTADSPEGCILMSGFYRHPDTPQWCHRSRKWVCSVTPAEEEEHFREHGTYRTPFYNPVTKRHQRNPYNAHAQNSYRTPFYEPPKKAGYICHGSSRRKGGTDHGIPYHYNNPRWRQMVTIRQWKELNLGDEDASFNGLFYQGLLYKVSYNSETCYDDLIADRKHRLELQFAHWDSATTDEKTIHGYFDGMDVYITKEWYPEHDKIRKFYWEHNGSFSSMGECVIEAGENAYKREIEAYIAYEKSRLTDAMSDAMSSCKISEPEPEDTQLTIRKWAETNLSDGKRRVAEHIHNLSREWAEWDGTPWEIFTSVFYQGVRYTMYLPPDTCFDDPIDDPEHRLIVQFSHASGIIDVASGITTLDDMGNYPSRDDKGNRVVHGYFDGEDVILTEEWMPEHEKMCKFYCEKNGPKEEIMFDQPQSAHKEEIGTYLDFMRAHHADHHKWLPYIPPTSKTEPEDSPEDDSQATTMGTSVANAPIKVLELFAGTGSVSKVVEATNSGAQSWSVDINEETAGHRPSKVVDILSLDYENLSFIPDIIWASPPCQTYSRMAGGKHRSKDNMEPKTAAGKLGHRILERTIQIINHFTKLNPALKYYIENPEGLMQYEKELWDKLKGHVRRKVSYCKYGFDYRKNTHIWTNDTLWKPRHYCTKTDKPPGSPCPIVAEHGKHLVGVRAHSGQGLKTGPQTLHERYRMPPDLIKEILESAFESVSAVEVTTFGNSASQTYYNDESDTDSAEALKEEVEWYERDADWRLMTNSDEDKLLPKDTIVKIAEEESEYDGVVGKLLKPPAAGRKDIFIMVIDTLNMGDAQEKKFKWSSLLVATKPAEYYQDAVLTDRQTEVKKMCTDYKCKERDCYLTPDYVLNWVADKFTELLPIDEHQREAVLDKEDLFDPCPGIDKVRRDADGNFIDGLKMDWVTPCYCNPPFSAGVIDKFIDKAYIEKLKGVHTLMLIPTAVSTNWFKKAVREKLFDEVVYYDGTSQVKFINQATLKLMRSQFTQFQFIYFRGVEEADRIGYMSSIKIPERFQYLDREPQVGDIVLNTSVRSRSGAQGQIGMVESVTPEKKSVRSVRIIARTLPSPDSPAGDIFKLNHEADLIFRDDDKPKFAELVAQKDKEKEHKKKKQQRAVDKKKEKEERDKAMQKKEDSKKKAKARESAVDAHEQKKALDKLRQRKMKISEFLELLSQKEMGGKKFWYFMQVVRYDDQHTKCPVNFPCGGRVILSECNNVKYTSVNGRSQYRLYEQRPIVSMPKKDQERLSKGIMTSQKVVNFKSGTKPITCEDAFAVMWKMIPDLYVIDIDDPDQEKADKAEQDFITSPYIDTMHGRHYFVRCPDLPPWTNAVEVYKNYKGDFFGDKRKGNPRDTGGHTYEKVNRYVRNFGGDLNEIPVRLYSGDLDNIFNPLRFPETGGAPPPEPLPMLSAQPLLQGQFQYDAKPVAGTDKVMLKVWLDGVFELEFDMPVPMSEFDRIPNLISYVTDKRGCKGVTLYPDGSPPRYTGMNVPTKVTWFRQLKQKDIDAMRANPEVAVILTDHKTYIKTSMFHWSTYGFPDSSDEDDPPAVAISSATIDEDDEEEDAEDEEEEEEEEEILSHTPEIPPTWPAEDEPLSPEPQSAPAAYSEEEYRRYVPSKEKCTEHLKLLDADMSYPDWFRVCCALKGFGEDYFSVFDNWSKTSKKGKYNAAVSKNLWDKVNRGERYKIPGWSTIRRMLIATNPEAYDKLCKGHALNYTLSCEVQKDEQIFYILIALTGMNISHTQSTEIISCNEDDMRWYRIDSTTNYWSYETGKQIVIRWQQEHLNPFFRRTLMQIKADIYNNAPLLESANELVKKQAQKLDSKLDKQKKSVLKFHEIVSSSSTSAALRDRIHSNSVNDDLFTTFNQEIFLLPFKDKVYDLKTNTIRKAEVHEQVSVNTGFDFPAYMLDADGNPTSRCKELWEDTYKFIDSCMLDGYEIPLRNYLLNMIACGLPGKNRYNKIVFLQGMAGAGKTTLQDWIKLCLGSLPKAMEGLAGQMDPQYLSSAKSNANSADGEIMKLVHKRLVMVAEPTSDKKNGADQGLNNDRVKQLSGNDTMCGRQLYKSQKEFKPHFSLFVACNTCPRLDTDDAGIVRRIVNVAFPYTFDARFSGLECFRKAGEVESRFIRKVNGERGRAEFTEVRDAGIMLLLHHWKEFVGAGVLADGQDPSFPTPKIVEEMTSGFLAEHSHFIEFKNERLLKPEGLPSGVIVSVTHNAIWAVYKKWVKDDAHVIPQRDRMDKNTLLQRLTGPNGMGPKNAGGTWNKNKTKLTAEHTHWEGWTLIEPPAETGGGLDSSDEE